MTELSAGACGSFRLRPREASRAAGGGQQAHRDPPPAAEGGARRGPSPRAGGEGRPGPPRSPVRNRGSDPLPGFASRRPGNSGPEDTTGSLSRWEAGLGPRRAPAVNGPEAGGTATGPPEPHLPAHGTGWTGHPSERTPRRKAGPAGGRSLREATWTSITGKGPRSPRPSGHHSEPHGPVSVPSASTCTSLSVCQTSREGSCTLKKKVCLLKPAWLSG